MAFSFFTQELAIDLGTANTVIFMKDKIVVDEPSIIAIDMNTKKPMAIGTQARLMHERTNPNIKTIRPMKDGVIADFQAAEHMIRGFIKMINSTMTCRLKLAFISFKNNCATTKQHILAIGIKVGAADTLAATYHHSIITLRPTATIVPRHK